MVQWTAEPVTSEDNSTIVNSDSQGATVVARQSDAPELPKFEGRETLKLLGVGGMAKVYLARDEVLNRELAIKVMATEMIDDAEFHERFLDEAKIVAGFKHPNIVTIYGFGNINDKDNKSEIHTPYIEMAFESGGALESRMEDGDITEQQALAIAEKMAVALAYSHEHRVVHRDFKPANILFSETGEPVLSDFGIAKGIDVTDHRTQTGFQIGSPRYMSPEQLRGERVTDRTDVYSLGLVFWETLVGSLPSRQLASIRNQDDAQLLKEALVKADPNFARYAEVLAACFVDDASDRPSAEEVSVMLAKLRQPRQAPRLRRILAATLIIGSLIVGALGLQLYYTDSYSFVTLSIEVDPASASIAVDGVAINSSEEKLRSGEHTVSATAPGYLGRAKHIELGDENAVVKLKLLPLTDLQKDEFLSFAAQFEDGAAEGTPITYPVFTRLLAMQHNAATDSQAFKKDLQELAILQRRNDPAAKLMRFLLDYNNLIELPGDEGLASLNDASDANYALATYYKAQIYQATRKSENEGEMYLVEDERYISLLEQADRQGLPWARELINLYKSRR